MGRGAVWYAMRAPLTLTVLIAYSVARLTFVPIGWFLIAIALGLTWLRRPWRPWPCPHCARRRQPWL